MSIRSLTQQEFDTFGPPDIPAGKGPEEVEWFVEGDGVVIGVVTHDDPHADGSYPQWAFSVLGLDKRGGILRVFDSGTDFKSLEDARLRLFGQMNKALASGDKVFPLGYSNA